MKNVNLFLVIGAVVLMSLAACGESEAEKQARMQAYQDSLRAAEQAKVAAMMEEMRQDSIAAAEAAAADARGEPHRAHVRRGLGGAGAGGAWGGAGGWHTYIASLPTQKQTLGATYCLRFRSNESDD